MFRRKPKFIPTLVQQLYHIITYRVPYPTMVLMSARLIVIDGENSFLLGKEELGVLRIEINAINTESIINE